MSAGFQSFSKLNLTMFFRFLWITVTEAGYTLSALEIEVKLLWGYLSQSQCYSIPTGISVMPRITGHKTGPDDATTTERPEHRYRDLETSFRSYYWTYLPCSPIVLEL